jgi:hypothetical protein
VAHGQSVCGGWAGVLATEAWRRAVSHRVGSEPADNVRPAPASSEQFLLYLTQVREAALPGLGEDEAVVHCHLEATAAAGDQGQALDIVAIAVKKLLRRPGGSQEVVSRHAVLDLNGQLLGHFLPPLVFPRGLLQHMLAPQAASFNRAVRFLKQFLPTTRFDGVPAGQSMITMCLGVQCRASGRWTRA